ncbi:NAD(P)H-quinone oxidoreductase [Nakamurella sp. PAMC28650]|uniref:NAD(P)H-quinone oxidoreductase n=1 Tax=Nakamurella sp. PAMC28650 TaxID=2762325 RepID=UPI00164EAE90|nr:NAD(P)H-quinone oxidoreductase [Nakamurella sp. PAMC28650]QNK81637.1 NAD(P)H-quinone oxidoreductase [Nakamurella sp. PAMC28650]
MLAITQDKPGGPESLGLTEVPDPPHGADEVLIRVTAGAVNRADLLQREGHYPVPAGASPILGMECSGTIVAVGGDVTGWQVGDEVCALLAGGGYAELVAVPSPQVLPIPAGVSLLDAAGLPEVACTVWSNVMMKGGLRSGQTLLVHGGSSGIGTMAIQVGKAAGATVIVTASRDKALESCRALGADVGINYGTDDFVEATLAATDGRGVDVILDVVGAKYLQRNISALALDGSLIVIGMMGGTRAELDLGALMGRRGSVVATALRGRPVTGPGSKGEIVAAVRDHLWPLIAAGTVRPVIDTVYPLGEAGQAHRRMAEGGHVGKIVLKMN